MSLAEDPFTSGSVGLSEDLERILALPRRELTEAELYELADDMTAVLKRSGATKKLRRLQALALYEIGTLRGGFFPLGVGEGKCLGKGTPVLMHDGTVKKVEDIRVGDELMGPDSLSRTVTGTCRGVENLYKVVPVKGDPYVVNESHILSLKQTRPSSTSTCPSMRGGRVKNLTVKEYLSSSDKFRKSWKGWRAKVTFPSKPVVEPYMLGVWLGDGSTDSPAITSADPEIKAEIRALAERLGVDVRDSQQDNNASSTYHFTTGKKGSGFSRNPVTAWLRSVGVLGNKHIPHDYKCNSREVRLQVLAGLIDSDGSYSNGSYDYITKLECLADDVCFLARSLGFAAYKAPCQKTCTNNGVVGNYFRICISGSGWEIPLRVERKKGSERKHKKSVLTTGIHLEPLGLGEYFGFSLAGPDRLFLLGDFTVTHNTLVSLMAAYVLNAKRVMLCIPAGLIKKTDDDRVKDYAPYWLVPNNICLFSYEKMGRVKYAGELESFFRHAFEAGEIPVLILDEVHKLKNPESAVAKRFIRFMEAHPETIVVALSGTVMDHSVLEFAHILRWCLKGNSPVPLSDAELVEWASALDVKAPRGNEYARFNPGELKRLTTGIPVPTDIEDEDERARAHARRGFRQRLVTTPGIVASFGGGEKINASIRWKGIVYAPTSAAPRDNYGKPTRAPKNGEDLTDDHFYRLRQDMKMTDDWDLSTPMEVWTHAREIALGLSYIWETRPPEEWLQPRKAWFKWVRQTLKDSSKNGGELDSPFQVEAAVRDGTLWGGREYLRRWDAIKDAFTPKTVPVWHDEYAIDACAEWARKSGPGIIWTEHTLFAQRLAKRTGLVYYGRKGLSSTGAYIDHADPKKSCIASADANKEGRNLQKLWCRNLITSLEGRPGKNQQLIGRTHRSGQDEDEVFVDVLIGCGEHLSAYAKLVPAATAVRDTTGEPQKVLLAQVEYWPGEFEAAKWTGARWSPPEVDEVEHFDPVAKWEEEQEAEREAA